MEKIQIRYGIQGNGMTFRLSLDHYKMIQKMYPKAQPAKGIFVEYDIKSDFVQHHAHLEKYIFPALLGFPQEEELQKIKKIEFVKTPELIVTYTIEQNYEQEKQPLLG
jgi:hypothetical protein